jgi:hypothetical protein
MALLHLLIAPLDHAPDHDVRLRVEFVELHPQVARVLRGVDFWRLGGGGLLLDKLQRVGVGEQRSQLFLKMVGLPRVLVDVILNGYLDRRIGTLYISLSCWTRSML